jgi:hypothetical protein
MTRLEQDDVNSDQEVREHKSKDSEESTLSSNIEDDNLHNQQEILHLDQARRDNTIQSTIVPLPNKRGHSDTVVARTSLPNLRHPASTIAPLLLKHQ